MRAMLEQQQDVFYYITVMNENYPQPTLPDGVAEDIVKGLYRYATQEAGDTSPSVRLAGSGTILLEVLAAAEWLATDWNIASEIWSATSYTELARDARAVERWNRLHPLETPRSSHVAQCLGPDLPVIAATDYVRAVPQLIASYIDAPLVVLGTDGFGRSDTRSMLRDFFEVDRRHIVVAALAKLAQRGEIDRRICAEAIKRYDIDPRTAASWEY